MSAYIKIFDIFEQFKETAPKNWDELEYFIDKCHEKGKEELAEYLTTWKADMHYYMEAEFIDFEQEVA